MKELNNSSDTITTNNLYTFKYLTGEIFSMNYYIVMVHSNNITVRSGSDTTTYTED